MPTIENILTDDRTKALPSQAKDFDKCTFKALKFYRHEEECYRFTRENVKSIIQRNSSNIGFLIAFVRKMTEDQKADEFFSTVGKGDKAGITKEKNKYKYEYISYKKEEYGLSLSVPTTQIINRIILYSQGLFDKITLEYDDTAESNGIPESAMPAMVEHERLTPLPTASHYKYSYNTILFGAPGTGKSYTLQQALNGCDPGDTRAAYAAFSQERFERVTFHPEYTYFDFVGSYKPVMKGGDSQEKEKISYDFVPGPFSRILKKALDDEEHEYCLIIEEINRARVAAVFGDVFQLLDRGENGRSEYSIHPSEELRDYLGGRESMFIPSNLYIWATMNSADQGVYPMDTAFKRRWNFEYLSINTGERADTWNLIRKEINNLLLRNGVNEDKLMGYYFLNAAQREDLEQSIKKKY